ncbi:MAG TPA: hypothetical protein PKN52_06780, partial [Trueperaceae bacterium]|nr:hypothetical protein [Trueperaceae bacterium]
MRKDGYTAMSGSVLPPEARLRELSAAAAAANHEFNYDEAMRHGREALAHVGLDPTADPGEWDACVAELDPATAASLANATTTLAISLFRRSDYVASLQVAQLEAHLRRHIGDEIGEAFASIGLGWCHHAVGLYQHALAHHSAALDVLERLAPKSIAGPLNGIARVYLDLGQPGLALEYAQRGLEAASASQHALRDTSTALRIVGLAHQQLNDPVAARSALEECFRRSDTYGKRFALLGHSMGAGIASLVAAACPGRIERLVAIEALGALPEAPENTVSRLRDAVAAGRALPGKRLRVFADL